MQKYKEINGNDYVKDSRTTINETMQSIQSMNSGTAFPTTNLFEGMKCYRTDLKKTYTLTDVENNTWVEDAHASLSDEATHAASATKLQTARSLNLGGAVTADAATFDGTANATINVKTLDATKLKGTASVSTTGNAATATKVVTTAVDGDSANIAEATMASNDLARIRVSGTTNAGELALETADDGSEPIVARQYTGIYEAPVRTAKILDESGNTSFPGTVVAPKFTGSLNGNAATATKLQTPRTLSLTGKAAGSTTFDGSSNASINVTSVNADTASKLSTARKINITGNASGSTTFDGTSDVSINVSVSQAAHADKATQDTNGRDFTDTNAYMHISALADNTDFNNVKTTGIYYCTGNTYLNRPHGSWGILTVYSIGTVKQEYRPDNAAVYYTREYNTVNWTEWSKVNAANADTATIASKVYGIYTANGGQQGPGYFGTNSAGCLMSNQPINGHDEYKNWLYMDNYNGSDVGGATAIGISRTETRAYIMSSNADRKQWDRTAELLSSANYNSFAPTKTGGGASGTWGINISGNADSATNADKLDGYHASDIINRISAANTGGIVAASLTENGYVKFANGLILQWGYTNANTHVNFPITFTSFVRIMCTCLNQNWAWVKGYSLKGFTLRADGGSFWFAIGA